MNNPESGYGFREPHGSGYVIPEGILDGDFREYLADPDYERAVEIVAGSQAGTPDEQLVEQVHIELSRAAAAFEDIHRKVTLEQTSPWAYMEVTDLFRSRIGMILSGQSDLHAR